MVLFDQINEDLKAAMKAREKGKLEALRNIKKVMLEAKSAKGAGQGRSFQRHLQRPS